jgi:CDP-6-deoxy-D-xylo-4-hexulose-3-dehydrase
MNNLIYPLTKNPFSNDDLKEGIKVIKSKQLTLSKKTIEIEKYFGKKFNIKYSTMVNSGSSANLLAFQTLINPYRKRRLKPNDEVLVPTLSWSTSFWPIVQSNLKPIFVDCDKNNLNIDIDDLRKKITKRTKCLILVHVLGHCANMDEIIKIVKKNKLILIEDTCESIGSKYKEKYLGTYGDFSSFSFYTSHQVSGGEGGMITCKNAEDYQIIRTLRSHGWVREIIDKNTVFKYKKNNYLDEKFTFCNSGFNLRPTEVSSAIALSQLKKLDKIKLNRSYNYQKIKEILEQDETCSKFFYFIDKNKFISECWLSFPIILKKKINKKKLLNKLYKNGIETRPIISGDFSQQPGLRKYNIKKQKLYKNADYIHKYGFYIGLYSEKISNKDLKDLKNSFLDSLN